MGRAKLKMELIANEKSRVLSYKKRKEGLIKKLHQLTTLCDVAACLIIDASAVSQTPGLEIWPPGNPDEVRRLIGLYKAKSPELGRVKMYGLSDFFEERLKEVEGGLHKLRKKNSEAKYPSWDNNFNSMDESQLRVLADYLQSRIQNVGARIEFLKMREIQGVETMKNMTIVDPNFSKIVGYEDMGCMNTMQTNFRGELGARFELLKMREKQGVETMKNMMIVDPNLDQFSGHQEMGCLNMMRTNSGGEFPSLEPEVTYNTLADDLQSKAENVGARIEFLKMRQKQEAEMMVVDPYLSQCIGYEDMGYLNMMPRRPMIGNQDYYAPPLWPANLQWVEEMNFYRGANSN